MNEKISRFLAERRPETPCLVVDLDIVAENYIALRRALPSAEIFYAVKANPAPPILSLLNGLGSNFDAASIYEIERCLGLGIGPERLSYGSTIKKQAAIAEAYDKGVRLFAFDSMAELDKLSRAAPGSRVFCRILMDGKGADWPLSDKFGCDVGMARDLLIEAARRGLVPYGVSFHVGSQQRDIGQWDVALGKTALIFSELNAAGIELRMVNMGGGLPARYRSKIAPLDAYARGIMAAVTRHFGNRLPSLVVEPGRCIPGDAGVIQSEVVLISRKTYDAERRWVYLDVGRFGGLPEVIDEAIKYRIRTPRDGGPTGPVIIAGPTCDEVDMLYDKSRYELPLDLAVGDRIEILSAGAYTASYSSVGFNGFPPLREYYI
jgi:ornithine decarboxylase